jgi:Zn-dependent protease
VIIFGFSTRVSVGAVLLAVYFGISGARFDGTSNQILAGFISGAGIIISIYLHELGHAICLRRYKLGVKEIVLHLVGGHTAMNRIPETPKQAAVVSGIGPVVSGLLGVILLAAGSATDVQVIFYLGGINLILAAINALPISGFDGAGVLEAALWKITKSRYGSRQKVATVSIFISAVAAGSGVSLFFAGSNGLFLLFVGVYLLYRSVQSRAGSQLLMLAEQLPIENELRYGICEFSSDDPIWYVRENIARFGPSELAHIRGNEDGWLSKSFLYSTRVDDDTLPVSTISVPDRDLLTVYPEDGFDQAFSSFAISAYKHRIPFRNVAIVVRNRGSEAVGYVTGESIQSILEAN